MGPKRSEKARASKRCGQTAECDGLFTWQLPLWRCSNIAASTEFGSIAQNSLHMLGSPTPSLAHFFRPWCSCWRRFCPCHLLSRPYNQEWSETHTDTLTQLRTETHTHTLFLLVLSLSLSLTLTHTHPQRDCPPMLGCVAGRAAGPNAARAGRGAPVTVPLDDGALPKVGGLATINSDCTPTVQSRAGCHGEVGCLVTLHSYLNMLVVTAVLGFVTSFAISRWAAT